MRRFAGTLFLVMVSAAIVVASVRAAEVAAVTYVRAGKLLDVRSGKLLTDQVIVIRGDRIERIAGSRELQIPAGATAVDLTRATVLPGLIDCHTQIGRASCRERV